MSKVAAEPRFVAVMNRDEILGCSNECQDADPTAGRYAESLADFLVNSEAGPDYDVTIWEGPALVAAIVWDRDEERKARPGTRPEVHLFNAPLG